jgi:phosphoenolpyruvate---glycerone phosphotransferase subunit DhaL
VSVDAQAVSDAFARVLRATEAAQPELDRLDAIAGDGDHGVTMVLGWRAVASAFAEKSATSPGGALRTAAEAFAGVGGSTGPLWGTALLRAGRALGDTPVVCAAEIAAAATAAAQGMAERGRCARGDRTVLDAMAPAAEALQGGLDLHAAAEAAAAGAEATAELEPRRGRDARAPERVRGHVDAGAKACATFWAAIAACDYASPTAARTDASARDEAMRSASSATPSTDGMPIT